MCMYKQIEATTRARMTNGYAHLIVTMGANCVCSARSQCVYRARGAAASCTRTHVRARALQPHLCVDEISVRA